MARAFSMPRLRSGMPVREIAAPADTLMFCLSKGAGRARRIHPRRTRGAHRQRRASIANGSAAACGRSVCSRRPG